MENEIQIRSAVPDDAEKLLKIYEPYVTSTAISFEYAVPSVNEFADRIKNTLKKYPYLCAVENGEITGYAYAGPFKEREAYDRSVETTVYVRQDKKRRGIGRKLYEALECALKKQGILNLYACIAYPEKEDEYLTGDSVLFHEKEGFSPAGRYHKCGYKFDRWYDMVWMEKIIGEHENKIKAVLFDMDGIIFDTERLAVDAWKMAGKDFGIDVGESYSGQFRGGNVIRGKQLFDSWFHGVPDYAEIRRHRDRYQREMIENGKLLVKKGYPELKQYLKEKGIKTCLVTSTLREYAKRNFEVAGLPFDFDNALCGTEIENGKPAPDVYLAAASMTGVRPGNCLVLEDSENGVKAGYAAGCSVIMVPDLDCPTPELEKMCIGICADLLEVLEKLKEGEES